jgi:hypothetical protein
MVEQGAEVDSAAITIVRRTWVQDAVVSYDVLVNGAAIGKVWPFQTKSFHVNPGPHYVRLTNLRLGPASSDDISVNVAIGETAVIRTVGRGLKSLLLAPLAFFAGARARAQRVPIQSRFYEPPWIHVRVKVLPAPDRNP